MGEDFKEEIAIYESDIIFVSYANYFYKWSDEFNVILVNVLMRTYYIYRAYKYNTRAYTLKSRTYAIPAPGVHISKWYLFCGPNNFHENLPPPPPARLKNVLIDLSHIYIYRPTLSLDVTCTDHISQGEIYRAAMQNRVIARTAYKSSMSSGHRNSEGSW